MRKTTIALLTLFVAALAAASPAAARVRVDIGLGFGCCWGGPWGYWPGYTIAPPPVLYYPPPPFYYPPVVTYAPPVRAPVNAAPASPVYLDTYGRSCREYQTTIMVGGAVRSASGTACLQPDGSWRVIR